MLKVLRFLLADDRLATSKIISCQTFEKIVDYENANLYHPACSFFQLWDVVAKKRLRSMQGHLSVVGSLSWNHYILSR